MGRSLVEVVTEKLLAVDRDLGGGTIGGFWIRSDPYLEQEEAVVLVLDAIDEGFADDVGVAGPTPSTEAAVSRSVDVCDLVADALAEIPMFATCRFSTSAALAEAGPPLDPDSFHPLRPAA